MCNALTCRQKGRSLPTQLFHHSLHPLDRRFVIVVTHVFYFCFDNDTQVAVHLRISNVEDHEFLQGCSFKVKSSPPLDFKDQLDLKPKFCDSYCIGGTSKKCEF